MRNWKNQRNKKKERGGNKFKKQREKELFFSEERKSENQNTETIKKGQGEK